MIGPGLKLLPPDKFDGDSDYERFTKLLYAYMGCQDNDYVHMMHTAGTANGPIGAEGLQEMETRS